MAKTVPVYTLSGTKSGTVKLPEAVFGSRVNRPLLTQAVRVFLSNQRRGLAKAKGRGDLTGITTAKVWRQKGTGRARHGSRRAPIFVGGGKAHGPSGTQNYRLAFPRKMRQAALKSALAAQVDRVIVADFGKVSSKTKTVAKFMAALAKPDRPVRNVLVVLEGENLGVSRSLRNLPKVSLRQVSQLTAFDVLQAEELIFTKESLRSLGTRLAPAVKTLAKKEA